MPDETGRKLSECERKEHLFRNLLMQFEAAVTEENSGQVSLLGEELATMYQNALAAHQESTKKR